MYGFQVVLDHVGRYRTPEHVAAILIEAEVNAAVDAGMAYLLLNEATRASLITMFSNASDRALPDSEPFF
jgi:hypothetical protein